MSTQPSAVALAIIAFMTYQLPPAFQLAPATWDDTDDTPTDDGAGCGMALDPAAESERRDVMRQVALDRCAQWALDDADDDLLPWEEELPEYEGADLDDWADGLADVDPMTIRGLLPVVDVDAWHEWALRVEAGDYNAAPVAGAERTGPLTGPVHDGPIALFFDELTLYSGGVWVQMTPSVLDWADAEDVVDPLWIG